MSVTQGLRRRLWDLHTEGRGAQDDPVEAFEVWQKAINDNKKRRKNNLAPGGPLVEFYYDETTLKDLD
ncbi:hypothetical protein [Pseudomonas sp. 18175]|uniref:hypothetical protein n=1 Tax=Pseudomonas sp. 18175 TaxID=3390056 RepID=UPI003D1F330C